MTRARFLYLPSKAQRLRRDGSRQPHRLYLADGTELPMPAEITTEAAFDQFEITADRLQDPVRAPKGRTRIVKLTLVFRDPEVRRITQKPKRRGAAR